MGSRAEAERTDGSGLVYRGSLIYRRDSSGALALEGVPFAAGRLAPGGVCYHVTDHLGSVCAVVDGNTNFYYGETFIPNAANNSSPDSNVYAFTASFLGPLKQVSNAAHELFGHAYFYELYINGEDVNPYHTYGLIGTGYEDISELGKIEYNIYGRTNHRLENWIEMIEKEAITNYLNNE